MIWTPSSPAPPERATTLFLHASYKFCGFDRCTPRATPLTIDGSIWSYDTDEEQKGKKIHIKTINDFSKPGIVTWNTKFTDDPAPTGP